MYRRLLSVCAVAGLGIALVPGASIAQQKSMKDQLVGAWTLLLVDSVKDDGTHVPEFGPNPDGVLMFSPNGRYSLEIARASLPKFASNDRDKGTADENKAVVQGTLSHFGTYAINDGDKSVSFRIESSSFPNWDAPNHRTHGRCVDLQHAGPVRCADWRQSRRGGVAAGQVGPAPPIACEYPTAPWTVVPPGSQRGGISKLRRPLDFKARFLKSTRSGPAARQH
jgi:hypothetical protein